MTGRRRVLVEVGLVLLLGGAMLVELAISDRPRGEVTLLSVLSIAAGTVPVLLRRRQPGLALAGCMAGLVLVVWVTCIYVTIPYPSVVSAYSLASAWGLRKAVIAGLLTAPVVLAVIGFKSPHGLLNWETPKNLGLVALPLALGVSEHNRRRMHEEETRGRVGEERLRIARDVHDVVAHAMVAINVQAGVSAHLLDRDPEQARTTLLDIKRTSGEALADLRSTLGVLRDPEDVDDVPVQPAVGLRELDCLRSSLDKAGLRLALDIDPTTEGLPASVDATGYRIVREALTNVLRHASSDEAVVRVRCEVDHLVIEVED
ncbi:MAG: histidine kinase, partial [Actinomycetota bacterium]|nr:histidine kinase [Actinomycetota bacterium]